MSKKDPSYSDLIDMEVFKILQDKLKKVEEQVIEIKEDLQYEKGKNRELKKGIMN